MWPPAAANVCGRLRAVAVRGPAGPVLDRAGRAAQAADRPDTFQPGVRPRIGQSRLAQVARGVRGGRVRASARRWPAGRDTIERDFAFMWIPQLMRCGIHMIMLRAAVPPGQSGQNGHGLGRVRSQQSPHRPARSTMPSHGSASRVAPVRRLMHRSQRGCPRRKRTTAGTPGGAAPVRRPRRARRPQRARRGQHRIFRFLQLRPPLTRGASAQVTTCTLTQTDATHLRRPGQAQRDGTGRPAAARDRGAAGHQGNTGGPPSAG